MGYILDVILLLIFLVSVLVGIKRGFIRSAARFLGSVVAACLSAVLGGIVAQWVFDTLFRDALVERIGSSIGGVAGAEGIANMLNSLPDFIVRALESAGVTSANLESQIAVQQGQIAEVMADAISPIFVGFLKVLAVVVLFMLFMVIVRILANMLGSMFNLPILNGVNSLLGGVFGLLIAIVFVWILIAGIQVFTPMLSSEMQDQVNETLKNSILTGFFVGFNPFNMMFQ